LAGAAETDATHHSPNLHLQYTGLDGSQLVLQAKPLESGLPKLDWNALGASIIDRFFPAYRYVDASSQAVPQLKDGEPVVEHSAMLSFVKGDASVADMERQVFGAPERGYDPNAFKNVMFWTDLHGERLLVKVDPSASAA
jgi:hypothetical protein